MTSPTPPSGAFVIPALNAQASLPAVLRGLHTAWQSQHPHEPLPPLLVINDGSSDATAQVALREGAQVISHPRNRGKGAALQTALHWAEQQGLSFLVSLDADGQHPPEEAVRFYQHPAPPEVLLLGTRNLAEAGAPRANQFSNRFSNRVLSLFSGQTLLDTQCGLRRYPTAGSLALGARDAGFAFECELVLRAARRCAQLLHVPCAVIYPPEEERVTHYDTVRDSARIVRRVVWTTCTVPHARWSRRWGERLLLLALLSLPFLIC